MNHFTSIILVIFSIINTSFDLLSSSQIQHLDTETSELAAENCTNCWDSIIIDDGVDE